jgi:Fe-S-cluster containining protein
MNAAIVDCEACTAPCCRRFAVWDSVTLAESEPHRLRQLWTAHAGAILHPVAFTSGGFQRWDCGALTDDARCAVYEDRPDICRKYDCRDDPSRLNGDQQNARCSWPR